MRISLFSRIIDGLFPLSFHITLQRSELTVGSQAVEKVNKFRVFQQFNALILYNLVKMTNEKAREHIAEAYEVYPS